MFHNAIVEQRFQLAILFHQIVKKDKQKYSAFSPAFLSLQFAELLGYPAHYIRSDVDLWRNYRKEAEEEYGPIRDWNTGQVTDMSELFCVCVLCTRMEYMFCDATAFNQPLAFDTSSCTAMEGMFFRATAFNLPLPLTYITRFKLLNLVR